MRANGWAGWSLLDIWSTTLRPDASCFRPSIGRRWRTNQVRSFSVACTRCKVRSPKCWIRLRKLSAKVEE